MRIGLATQCEDRPRSEAAVGVRDAVLPRVSVAPATAAIYKKAGMGGCVADERVLPDVPDSEQWRGHSCLRSVGRAAPEKTALHFRTPERYEYGYRTWGTQRRDGG